MVADGDRLCYLDFAGNEDRGRQLLKKHYSAFSTTDEPMPNLQKWLGHYFAREWDACDKLDLGHDLCIGGTDFQREVWDGLQSIPRGEVLYYEKLAGEIGKPNPSKYARPVGQANKCNPIAIVIPCHRVICKDRSLSGYTGGTALQAWLLGHEGVGFDRLKLNDKKPNEQEPSEQQAWQLGREGKKFR